MHRDFKPQNIVLVIDPDPDDDEHEIETKGVEDACSLTVEGGSEAMQVCGETDKENAVALDGENNMFVSELNRLRNAISDADIEEAESEALQALQKPYKHPYPQKHYEYRSIVLKTSAQKESIAINIDDTSSKTTTNSKNIDSDVNKSIENKSTDLQSPEQEVEEIEIPKPKAGTVIPQEPAWPNGKIPRNFRLKIADFNLARTYTMPTRTMTHEIITRWYRPPEILLGIHAYTPAVDIWSLGCIFAELATWRPLFPGESEIDQLFRIFRYLGTPTEETWPGVTALQDYSCKFPEWSGQGLEVLLEERSKRCGAHSKIVKQDVVLCPLGLDLMKKMLTMDPSKRISADDALAHPYFKDIVDKSFHKLKS